MEKKYILFDMDGVLINTEPLHFRVWKIVAKEYGIDLDYDIYKGCIGSTVKTLYRLIREGYDFDFSKHPEARVRFFEVKDSIIEEEGIPQIDGAKEVVEKLFDRGYQMAVASSSQQEYIDLQMKKLGIAKYFKAMCSGEGVPNPKPAPDVFLKACKEIGATPEQCIVVEDSCNGTKAVKAAGMYCIGIANPDSGEQDLSAADIIVDSIKEILDIIQ